MTHQTNDHRQLVLVWRPGRSSSGEIGEEVFFDGRHYLLSPAEFETLVAKSLSQYQS